MARHRTTACWRGRAAGALLISLALAGCADAPSAPPKLAEADQKPMVAPEASPSSPDFNIRVAKPLANPEAPALVPLPVPDPPPPPVVMQPLPNPEPPALVALPVAEAPPTPPQRAKPITAPAEPAHDTLSALEPKTEPKPQQTASLPMGGAPAKRAATEAYEPLYRLEFAGPSPELPASAGALLGTIAGLLSRNEHLRLKLNSFASGSTDDPVAARRLSLQRALKVRAMLIEKGIPSTRVDVLALGLTATEPPADRIDLVPAE